MTDEEIKALQDAKEAAEKKAADAEALAIAARAEADKSKADLTNVVDELKAERLKKAEALAKANLTTDGTDVNALIEAALQTRESQSRADSFKEALLEFKAAKPEFQADAAGLVYSKFENGLKRFNFSDITNKEQMKSRLEEAYRFLNATSLDNSGQEYEGGISMPNSINQPQTGPSKDIKAVLESTGMDEARFKTLKEKYPEALESLGM